MNWNWPKMANLGPKLGGPGGTRILEASLGLKKKNWSKNSWFESEVITSSLTKSSGYKRPLERLISGAVSGFPDR
jgi:hypothetical protein